MGACIKTNLSAYDTVEYFSVNEPQTYYVISKQET